MSLSVREAIREYLLDCQARRLSERTITWYEGKLGHFAEFLQERGIERIETAANPRVIREYLNELRTLDSPRRSGEKISGHTVAGYDQVLRSFFHFLVNDELIARSPMEKIRKVRRPQTLIPTYTVDEVHRMLQVYASKRTFAEHRNYLILLTLYDTGMRRRELLRWRTEDISNDFWSVTIRSGKGDKDRMVPLGKLLRKELIDYLPRRDAFLRERGHRDTGYVFIRERDGGPLSASFVYRRVVRAAGEQAGIAGKRLSPHSWRHTSAVDYLRAGGDLFSLQQKLGHSDLKTTQLYVRLADEDIRIMHRRYSPLDHLDRFSQP